MGYDNMHRITSKSQHLSQDNVQFNGTLNVGYDLTYTYGTEDGKKFQLASVKDVNYRTEETPGDNKIENNHVYLYDKNGNLIYVNTGRLMNDGHNETGTGERKLIWDEENRLLAVDDNGFVSNYWYDADGERTIKTSGESDQVYVNGVFSSGSTNTAKFSLYVSPYLVANQGGRYTKHIYAGSQRIVSKIGDFASYGSDPRRIEYAGANTDGLSVDYKAKYAAQQQVIKDNYKTFDVPYNGTDNDNYADGEGFCCNDGSMEAAVAQVKGAQARAVARSFKDPDNYENLQFFYHPDHLGSSSFITNLEGEVVQHIEYVPFGEVFIEERNNVWNTPYLFNAKEFDEETGMYYYGARYYEPKLSVWISVDPISNYDPLNSENYLDGEHNNGFYNNMNLNPYSYCYLSPVILIDPNGKQAFFGNLYNKKRAELTKKVCQFVAKKACQYVAKKVISGVESKLDETINSDNNFATSLALTTEFILGIGPESRTFGPNHPFTQELKESHLTTMALEAFYKGYQDYKAGNRKSIPDHYRVDFGPFGETGPIQGMWNDGGYNSASQFIGTATYYFQLDKNDVLNIRVEDSKTEYSLFYHAPFTDRHSRNEKRILGETFQKYKFSIPLNEVKKRVSE